MLSVLLSSRCMKKHITMFCFCPSVSGSGVLMTEHETESNQFIL
jgi:hypothetical protein